MPDRSPARRLPAAAPFMRSGLSALLILIGWSPAIATAQSPPESPAIAFLGFRPGRLLSETDSLVASMGGNRLRCDRGRIDPSLSDCRAILVQAGGGDLELWLSAVDSLGAVLTVSGEVTDAQLQGWQEWLAERYGPSITRVQGIQRMRQWIVNRQMLRLTWRSEPQGLRASVSLVDGPVLDGWGDRQPKPATGRPTAP